VPRICSRNFLTVIVLLSALLPVLAHANGASPGNRYAWHLFTTSQPKPLFYEAAGIAIGGAGNIFIADSGDHRVEKFAPSGSLRASWGTDQPGNLRFKGPRAITVDRSGNMYLADNGVVKLSSIGRFLRRWTGGVLSYPRGLTTDRQGNVYVLSMHPAPDTPLFDRITITKITPTGKAVRTSVYSYPQPLADAALSAAITTTPAGNLVLSLRAQRHCHSCNGTYYVLRTISPTGQTIAQANEDAGGNSVAVDAAGDIFVTKSGAIERLSSTGTLVTTFGTPGCGTSQLGTDLRIATSPQGSVYVADSQIATIRLRDGVLHRFAPDGTPEALLGQCPSASTLFQQLQGLAHASDGTLYAADPVASKVFRITPAGVIVGSFDTNHAEMVATDWQDNVYVPDLLHNALDKYSPNGTLLAQTTGFAFENVAIAPRTGTIYALTAFGELLVLPPVGHGNKPTRHWWLNGFTRDEGGLSPQGICLDGQGNIWVADIRHNNIQKYAPSGRLLKIWGRQGTGPNRFRNPNALTVDGNGHLFVVDGSNNRVQEFDLHGRFLAMYGREGMAPGQFQNPFGIAADAQGNIYIGDRDNDRIQELVRQR
jgi:sugar lactone lactonase YvrE